MLNLFLNLEISNPKRESLDIAVVCFLIHSTQQTSWKILRNANARNVLLLTNEQKIQNSCEFVCWFDVETLPFHWLGTESRASFCSMD